MLQKKHKIDVKRYQEVYGKIPGHGFNPKLHTKVYKTDMRNLVFTGFFDMKAIKSVALFWN